MVLRVVHDKFVDCIQNKYFACRDMYDDTYPDIFTSIAIVCISYNAFAVILFIRLLKHLKAILNFQYR